MKIPHAVAANTAWGIFYIMCKTSTWSWSTLASLGYLIISL